MTSHNLANLPAAERQRIEDEKSRLFEEYKRQHPDWEEKKGRK